MDDGSITPGPFIDSISSCLAAGTGLGVCLIDDPGISLVLNEASSAQTHGCVMQAKGAFTFESATYCCQHFRDNFCSSGFTFMVCTGHVQNQNDDCVITQVLCSFLFL